MIRLPLAYAPKLLALFTSFIMSFVMSMVITFLNLGWVDNFIQLWMNAWFSAFLIAFPTILLVLPIARRMVSAITHQE